MIAGIGAIVILLIVKSALMTYVAYANVMSRKLKQIRMQKVGKIICDNHCFITSYTSAC